MYTIINNHDQYLADGYTHHVHHVKQNVTHSYTHLTPVSGLTVSSSEAASFIRLLFTALAAQEISICTGYGSMYGSWVS